MTSMVRSSGGELSQSRGSSKPGSLSTSLMKTLWLSAVLFPSSEQENCGTKRVTFTFSCWANSVASSLLKVDKPPLDESHSLANRVTLNAVPNFP